MKKSVLIILFLVFILSGCSTAKLQDSSLQVTDSQTQPLQPKQVVENYFKYYNAKNKEALLTTLTEWHNAPNIEFGLENLKYIKLNSITEDVRPSQKEGYMKYGPGKINGVKEENIIIYKVVYTVKYKKDGVGPQDSGKYIKSCTLIRKDQNAPWLIDELGE